MAKAFIPNFPFLVAFELLIPTYTKEKSTVKKTFPEVGNGVRMNCSFKTYGGTETTENGVYSVIDTATIETWYDPRIAADCRICILQTGKIYEIIGTPENIDMRGQFCRFKVQAIEGGA